MNKTESFEEILARCNVFNLVWWFLNRPVWPVETKGMAEMPDKVPDTIPARPGIKRENDNA